MTRVSQFPITPVEASDRPKLFTVKKFVERHGEWATEGGIRHLLFHRDQNGFGRCVRYVGRRILLDEDEVMDYIKCQN